MSLLSLGVSLWIRALPHSLSIAVYVFSKECQSPCTNRVIHSEVMRMQAVNSRGSFPSARI
jgi:hypothetical protein